MRSGKWKYLRDGKNESLFDLSVDEHEQASFGDSQPAMLSKLRDQFTAWESQMMKYPDSKDQTKR